MFRLRSRGLSETGGPKKTESVVPRITPHKSLLATLIVGAALSALAGCASAPPQRTAVAKPIPRIKSNEARAATAGHTVAQLAIDLIGTPYRYGGTNPDEGFDCSGLVFYAYAKTGWKVPRTSVAQFKSAKKIALAQAAQGDLVFFQDQTKLSHVGIYLGNGLFVHAPSAGHTVSIASLDTPYYRRHLVAVGRILPN